MVGSAGLVAQVLGQLRFAIDEIGEEMVEGAAVEGGGEAVEAVVDEAGLLGVEDADGGVDVDEHGGADRLGADEQHGDATAIVAAFDQGLHVVAFDDDHRNAETHGGRLLDRRTGVGAAHTGVHGLQASTRRS